MLDKLTSTPAGKVGIAAVAVLALGLAIFEGVKMTKSDGAVYADPKQVQDSAAKQVEQIQKQNLPPALKAEMLSHYQGMAQGSRPNGAASRPPTGAPPSGQ